jgi:alkanesulfonate monooxygenase SsuD/methylene tetrahydromethanopterin reductase-like flavin-dependent oxidoreductase (luciferase family)
MLHIYPLFARAGAPCLMDFALFDNLQIDPLDPRSPADIFDQRLDDLAVAEAEGFWAAFTAERHFMATYRSVAPGAWIAAASQRTSKLRLGVLAYTLALHQPAQLAEEIAFLDQLSHGRLEVGVGLGHRPAELEQTGIDPARRIPLFQERFAILSGLLTGASVRVESDFHTLRDVGPGLVSLQRPSPPLWYAGTDPRAGAWAGLNGLSLAVGFAPAETLAPIVQAFREARAEYVTQQQAKELPMMPGRVALMRAVYLSDSDQTARAEMADDIYRLNALDPRVHDGSRPNRRSDAAAEVERITAQEMVIGGGPEELATYLGRMKQLLGIDTFIASVYPAGVEQERAQRSMRLLMRSVAPAMR